MKIHSTFGEYHPIVNFVYFVSVIGITMFSMNPVFLALTFIASFIYSVLLGGRRAFRFNLLFMLPVLVLTAIINPLFNHRGVTVLFYLNGNAMTLEAILFGLASAVMLTSVIIWFSCAGKILNAEKFIYLFGRVLPVLALTLSMSFRFVPLFKMRYRQIEEGQISLGRAGKGGVFSRIRMLGKQLSILISWSFEAAIETSDSMEARGYGLRGRTSFHLYRFNRYDAAAFLIIAALSGIVIAGCCAGVNNIVYYPAIVLGPASPILIASLFAYALLLILPMLFDLEGALRWKRLYSTM